MTKEISQIFLSDKSEELPRYIQQASKTIKVKYPEYNYEVYDLRKLENFIRKNYDNEVLWAFRSLRPFSYKSDLGRFCLLYKKGGWYFDIAIKCLYKYEVDPSIDMVCFRDEQRHSQTSWAVAGGIIWSKPRNNILSTAIDMIIRNCREKWYGRTPLCPTGPALFGEAIAKENRGKNISFGYLERPMVPFTNKNFPYFKRIIKASFRLENNRKFALLKPSAGGDLKNLGVKGANNYNDYWKTGKVYAEINPDNIDIIN